MTARRPEPAASDTAATHPAGWPGVAEGTVARLAGAEGYAAPIRAGAAGTATGAVRSRGTGRRSRAGAALLAVALGAALVAGCGGRPTTHHKPGTSHQEATGGAGTLLDARDSTGRRLREVPATGAPTVRAEARPDSEGGWNVHLLVERFRFTPESTGGAALPGRGHARLLLDGRETARAYGPWSHVPAGTRTLTVRLYADDHTVWAVAGRPVETAVRLGTGASDPGASATGPAPAPPATPATPSPPSGRTVTITVTGTSVQPPPSRVEVKKGERVTLRVTSDRADTLHVHGYDRELRLSPGTTATLTLTADRTGLFEVETHTSALVLTQLVVR
ncbi:hypothetical protein [Streptomyces laurentii]|uniref:hypothetical protein n=1 Tax=Streptomyces laurentii TaxID=39478 RepID=UPI00369AF792